jgi:3-hydroxybutyryl-CoA dehydratase
MTDEQGISATLPINSEIVAAWAELSGDHNRLHVDPDFAATTPYGRCIAHGPLVASMVAELVAEHVGKAWRRSPRTVFKFIAPVFVPSSVQVAVEILGPGSARAVCTADDGSVVLHLDASWDGAMP